MESERKRKMKFTEKELLALSAVYYGCNANKRLIGSSYVQNFREPDKRKEIPFHEALEIVRGILEEK